MPARFIPTCVGLTTMFEAMRCRDSVHPHVRGAYHSLGLPFMLRYGSSPRAWGLLLQVGQLVRICRFIPTCVGLTTAYGRRICRRTVHPHVRGAYTKISVEITCVLSTEGRLSLLVFALAANSGKTEHMFRTTGTLIPFETEQN